MTNNVPPKRVMEICDEVLLLKSDQRTRYLDRVCGKDSDTRQQVESLLKAIDDSGSFLIVDDMHNDKDH